MRGQLFTPITFAKKNFLLLHAKINTKVRDVAQDTCEKIQMGTLSAIHDNSILRDTYPNCLFLFRFFREFRAGPEMTLFLRGRRGARPG